MTQQASLIADWYRSRRHEASAPVTAQNQPAGPRVAIQGEPGSFSHEAALKLVPGATVVPCSVSAEVFAALDSGKVEAAAIPIENSLAGSVLEHFDLLLRHNVRVVSETLLRIKHNLIALDGTELEQIERVFSHPVALAQCRRFLAEHPAMESFAFYDTAGSVKQLVELKDAHAAGIASEAAAAFYGAKILKAGIEDNAQNYTRFFLIKRAAEATLEAEVNKMSLAFLVINRPGSLADVLNELSRQGVNMTKLESRPVPGKPWEYIFYLDCQIQSPEEGQRAIAAIAAHCTMVKEIGSYHEAHL